MTDLVTAIEIGLTSAGSTLAATSVALPFVASPLAQHNIWFTTVPEGYARAIKNNGRFHSLYMSFADHMFRGRVKQEELDAANQEKRRLENIIWPQQRILDKKWNEIKELYDHLNRVISLQHDLDQAIEDKHEQDTERFRRDLRNENARPIPEIKADIKAREEECSQMEEMLAGPKQEYANLIIPHKWDIIPGNRLSSQGFLAEIYPFGLMRGIHLVGMPGFYEVHTYNFVWRNWELAKKADGTWGKDAVEHGKDEKGDYIPLQHILLSDDVYYAKVYNAETVDGIPVNMAILMTIQIQNPYKALFRIEQWLQATENHVETAAVQFIRTKTFEALSQMAGETQSRAPGIMNNQFHNGLWNQVHFTRNEYGVFLKLVQVLNIDPSTERGREFRDLLLANTTKERLGRAAVTEAQYRKQVRVIDAQGVADAINLIADAEHNQTEKVDVYAAQNGATEAWKYRRMSDPRSPVTTWVDGGGASINITPQPPKPRADLPQSPISTPSPNEPSSAVNPSPDQARPEDTNAVPSDPTQREPYKNPTEGYDPAAGYTPPSTDKGPSVPKKPSSRKGKRQKQKI